MSAITLQLSLNNEVTCPWCWHKFPPEKTLSVATHPALLGDLKLGPDHGLRFLPTRFDARCEALDLKMQPCSELACPHCHLVLPRSSVELKPVFLSIAGTPSCGKSYFLASMVWQLRQTLAASFKLSIVDADPACNAILNDYEEQQFFSADRETPVRLKKTEEQGDHYATSLIDGQSVQFPKPFLFNIKPLPGHPNLEEHRKVSRMLCLYDNAGESYTPGRDTVANPVTRHLSHATAIFFCFDPLQDPRTRASLGEAVKEPSGEVVTARQQIVFHEVASRFRRLHGLGQSETTDRPVVVIVTKFDLWQPLVPQIDLPPPVIQRSDGMHAIDIAAVRQVSAHVRQWLQTVSPELVSAADALSRHVWFIPVSATGGPQIQDPETGRSGFRPRDIQPTWCDVPLLTVLSQHGQGLIPFVDRN